MARDQQQPTGQMTFMDPALMPWVLVSELYWMSYKLLERRLYHLNLSPSQARVLAVLYTAERPMKPSFVATLVFQETQSITGIIGRIEARGWVRRLPDENDRRAIGLVLTDEGKAAAAEVMAISGALYSELFAPALSPVERRQVESGLRKVRERAFKMPETDFKLRRAQQHALWRD